MNCQLVSAIVALSCLAPAAYAQGTSSAVEGLGLQNCSKVVSSKDDDPDLYRGYAAWLNGFLSAANAYEADTYDMTPWQPIEMSIAQVTQYCKANPDRRLAEATAAYLSFLRDDRLKEPSELTSLRNGKNGVFLYDAIVDRVREKLRADGLLGQSDGETFDKAFGDAVTAFQRANNLPTSGLPDTATLIRLFQ